MARHALESIVIVLGANNGPYHREFIHDGSDSRHMFANLDAWDFGVDRLELPANFGRRVQLQIEHVLMRRATWQENHDNCFVGFADTGLRLGS
jgi:hypothetical protein